MGGDAEVSRRQAAGGGRSKLKESRGGGAAPVLRTSGMWQSSGKATERAHSARWPASSSSTCSTTSSWKAAPRSAVLPARRVRSMSGGAPAPRGALDSSPHVSISSSTAETGMKVPVASASLGGRRGRGFGGLVG